MTEDQLNAFITAAQADPALMKRLDGTDDLNSIVAVAKDAGYSISADDLKNKAGVDLSDEELEATCCASTGTVRTGISLCIDC